MTCRCDWDDPKIVEAVKQAYINSRDKYNSTYAIEKEFRKLTGVRVGYSTLKNKLKEYINRGWI